MNYKKPVLLMMLLLVAYLANQRWDFAVLIKDAAPVNYVRVGGVFQHLAKKDIKQVLQPMLDEGFVTADLQAIREATVSLPWVADAKVSRAWPDAIDIRVFEQQPYMRWGRHSLINEQGHIFTLNDTDEFGHLPVLNCPRGQQQRFLEIMKGLQIALADISLNLYEFTVTERLSWQLILDNGMQIKLGKKEPLKNLQRFIKSAPLLGADKIAVIDIVDMRYPNGFALTWKPGVIIDWQANDGSNA